MKDKAGFHIGAGITSIFMLFIVLCLTVFAILSYGTAKADYNLSKQSAGNLEAYYQARNRAVRAVADINECIMKDKSTIDQKDFLENIKVVIAEKGYSLNKQGNIQVSVEINQKQTFEIELKINAYEDKTGVTILRSYVSTRGAVNSNGVPVITE